MAGGRGRFLQKSLPYGLVGFISGALYFIPGMEEMGKKKQKP